MPHSVFFRWIIHLKKALFLFSMVLLLTHCAAPNEKAEVNQAENQQVTPTLKPHDEPSEATTTSPPKKYPKLSLPVPHEPFDIRSLPTEWTAVSIVDYEWVIYNSCDAGNRKISILHEGDQTDLLLHGEQEDYQLTVLECGIDGRQYVHILAQWQGSEEQQLFQFSWTNEAEGLAAFETTYSEGHKESEMIVTNEFVGEYPVINQPCIECWPEEECDAREKQKTKD